jgi:predicted transcriptional regulator
MVNSQRFLNAFNSIERHLHKLVKKEKVTSFYSLVDSAGESNAAVRHFKTDLKEYADLRNAIVHERTDEHVIAEPNDEAVAHLERIAFLLLDPPKVLPDFQSQVRTLAITDPIANAVKVMYEQSFSQMPIYDAKTFSGLLTTNTVARWLGDNVQTGIVSLNDTLVAHVFNNYTENKDNFSFLARDSTLFDVMEKFQKYQKGGKRLEAMLITDSGKLSEKLLGIITIWDLPRIQEKLGSTT